MKKIFALLAFVLAFTLTACGSQNVQSTSESQEKPQETSSTESTESTDEVEFDKETLEFVFVKVITDKYPEFYGLDQDLLDAGYRLCAAADSGATLDDYYDDALESGMEFEMYGWILGSALSSLCPEHENMFDEFGTV